MTRTVIAPFLGPHDHEDCLDEALRTAEQKCTEQGLRLTALRRRVLALIWQSHKPQRAYDVIEGLKKFGHRPAPPTAYRALEFLEQAGLIHRIESLNAYIGCAEPQIDHTGQFFICDECDAVAEVQDTALDRKLVNNAGELGFTPKHQTIEVHGVCSDCTGSDQER